MPDDDSARLACASYTFARRHPMVLGRIGGWSPPVQLTITQILVLVGSFALLTWTWSAWAPVLPDTVAFMVAVGGPSGAAWAVRGVRAEGRTLPRAAVGWVTLWCAPRTGRVGGRPHRPGRPVHTAGTRMWVAGEPEP